MCSFETIIIELQIQLNRDIYEMGKITYEMYQKVNELLMQKLAKSNKTDEENIR